MTQVGAWDRHHGSLVNPKPYGDADSYRHLAELAAGCAVVADWGCGGGALAQYLDPEQFYVGVDGSATPFASVRADLRHYRCEVDCVVLRHVLEHNEEWQLILDNAIESAHERVVVALFTPLVAETRVMFHEPDYGNVPVLAFRLDDILARCPSAAATTMPSPGTAFGEETFIVVRHGV